MSIARITKPFLWAVMLVGFLAIGAFAQEADTRFPGAPPKNDDDQPVGIRENRKKMEIDQEKKEYEEMVDRGQQALKLSQDIEKAFQQQPSITRADMEKLDELEKLVKKVRSSLGGGNDNGDNEDADETEDTSPKTIADGVKALTNYAGKLADELNKTSRFGISAVAIQSSNSVLRVVRFLKGSK